MAEMSADLAEEHTTANNASEMLEGETSERLRLEKELKDMKVRVLLSVFRRDLV